MESPTTDFLNGKLRLLATQVILLHADVANIAEAVLTEDDTHRAMLIERVEGDLGQLRESLSGLIGSLD